MPEGRGPDKRLKSSTPTPTLTFPQSKGEGVADTKPGRELTGPGQKGFSSPLSPGGRGLGLG